MLMMLPLRCFSMVLENRLGHVEDALQVGGDHHIEIGFAHAHEQLVLGDAGVVHQNIQLFPSRPRPDPLQLAGIEVTGIALDREHLAAIFVASSSASAFAFSGLLT